MLNVGSPVEMPWLAEVPPFCSSGGRRAGSGNALADVPFGDVTPGKRRSPRSLCAWKTTCLPQLSWRKRPCPLMAKVSVGYRYYDKRRLSCSSLGMGYSYNDLLLYENLVL